MIGKKRPVLPSEDGKKRQFIQVCWDLEHSHTQEREVHSLLSAMNELEVNRGDRFYGKGKTEGFRQKN